MWLFYVLAFLGICLIIFIPIIVFSINKEEKRLKRALKKDFDKMYFDSIEREVNHFKRK